MKHDTTHRHLRLQHFPQVPADRLALSVGVRCEQQFRRALDCAPEVRHLLLLAGRHHVIGRELGVHVHTQTSPALWLDLLGHVGRRLRQVANMAEARLDAILGAKEAPERLGLGRRLNDDQRFCHKCLSRIARSARTHETAASGSPHQLPQFKVQQTGQQAGAVQSRRLAERVEIVRLPRLHGLEDWISATD